MKEATAAKTRARRLEILSLEGDDFAVGLVLEGESGVAVKGIPSSVGKHRRHADESLRPKQGKRKRQHAAGLFSPHTPQTEIESAKPRTSHGLEGVAAVDRKDGFACGDVLDGRSATLEEVHHAPGGWRLEMVPRFDLVPFPEKLQYGPLALEKEKEKRGRVRTDPRLAMGLGSI